jgi:hypothetical protein
LAKFQAQELKMEHAFKNFLFLKKKTPNFWEENLFVKNSITFQYNYLILVQFSSFFLVVR